MDAHIGQIHSILGAKCTGCNQKLMLARRSFYAMLFMFFTSHLSFQLQLGSDEMTTTFK